MLARIDYITGHENAEAERDQATPMFDQYKAFPLSLNEWTVQEYLSFMSTDQVYPWPQPECRFTIS